MVDVESVTSSIPRSNFLESDLDLIADMILESRGILKPLVLKKIGFEKYEVIDGHFEYYAAARAREKNPSEGEMINALIVLPEEEEAVVKQAAALRSLESPDQPVKALTETPNLESRLANIEIRFEKQINEFRVELARDRQSLEDKLKEIESHIPKRIEPLEVLNTLSKDDLAIKLQRSRVRGAEKIAEAIVDARRKKQKQKFEDYRDIVKYVKELGEKTMLSIIDDWSRS
jgi:hypothetical protein